MPSPCQICLDCYCACGEFDLRVWACFAYSNTACERQAPGCAVGCFHCFDNAGTGTQHVGGITVTGRRWARPAEFDRRPAFMTRDAWGWVSPLRSNLTTLLTRNTIFQIAQCYNTTGGECFEDAQEDGPCGCSYEHGSLCDPDFECLTEADAARYTWPDCIFYHGSGVPQNQPEIDCRHCGDAHTRWIAPTFGLPEGDRLGNIAEARTRACASNAMVATIGAVPRSNRCCILDDSRVYYVDGQKEQLWTVFELAWEGAGPSPQYVVPEDASPAVRAKLQIQNVALDYIRANAGSLPGDANSSVDTLYHDLPPGGGRNFQLDLWVGRCVPDGCNERVIMDLPNSYLRFSGIPVSASIVLEKVNVNMSFLLHKIDERQQYGVGNEMRPGGRIEIEVILAVRCEFIGDPPNGLAWQEQLGTCSRKRLAGGLDEVVLVNADGVGVQVPYRFVWRGGRTEWTMSQFPPTHPDTHERFCGGHAGHSQSCRFAAQLTLASGCHGQRWLGMPSRYPAEPTPRDGVGDALQADIWTGGINFKIPQWKFDDKCPGDCAEGVEAWCL